MGQFWALMGPATLASLIMSPVHCLFGLHIVRRGVIFIDLAVAQVAALGMALAVSQGHEPQSMPAYWLSLSFALGAALLIAVSKFRLGKVPHEAVIGIIFVVASAAGIVILENTPHGLEELKDIMAGSILFVQTDHLKTTAMLYAGVLFFAIVLWRYFTAATLQSPDAPKGWKSVIVDFAFYGLLAFVVASSVKIAGVLVVFTWLVMPAVCAFFFVDKIKAATIVSLPIAVIASAGGLWVSYSRDWPTGAAIVVAFGAVVAGFYVVRLFIPNRAGSVESMEGRPPSAS